MDEILSGEKKDGEDVNAPVKEFGKSDNPVDAPEAGTPELNKTDSDDAKPKDRKKDRERGTNEHLGKPVRRENIKKKIPRDSALNQPAVCVSDAKSEGVKTEKSNVCSEQSQETEKPKSSWAEAVEQAMNAIK